jgi:hypothetical protein
MPRFTVKFARDPETKNLVWSVLPGSQLPDIEPETAPVGSGRYYVYVHRDAANRIFYVGKGCGDRAWSTARQPEWHWYVNTRSGGQYTVQIVSHHETEEEALSVESDYLEQYGSQLINWQNPGRDFDDEATERYWTAKKANQLFVMETRALETTDPSQAAIHYQEAMSRMYEYERIVLERGLLAEFMHETGADEARGDRNILNRLTLCLRKLARYQELVDEVDRFVKLYPRVGGPMMEGILKRRAKAAGKL